MRKKFVDYSEQPENITMLFFPEEVNIDEAGNAHSVNVYILDKDRKSAIKTVSVSRDQITYDRETHMYTVDFGTPDTKRANGMTAAELHLP